MRELGVLLTTFSCGNCGGALRQGCQEWNFRGRFRRELVSEPTDRLT